MTDPAAHVLADADIADIVAHVTAPGVDPRATHIPNGSVAALIGMLREVQAERDAMRDMLGSISLYVKWRWTTKQLTREQKEMWADAVDAWSMAMQVDDGEDPHPVAERWWRNNFVERDGR